MPRNSNRSNRKSRSSKRTYRASENIYRGGYEYTFRDAFVSVELENSNHLKEFLKEFQPLAGQVRLHDVISQGKYGSIGIFSYKLPDPLNERKRGYQHGSQLLNLAIEAMSYQPTA